MKIISGVNVAFRYFIAWLTLGSPGYLPQYRGLLPLPPSFSVAGLAPFSPAIAHASENSAPPAATLPPLTPLPSGGDQIVGAIPGSFSVGQNGLPNYTIKIAVPPGTKDLAPELALTFTGSKKGNIVGPGWVLQGLSAISRCNAVPGIHGYAAAVQLNDNDKVCLDGEALTTIAGQHMKNGSEMRSLNEQMTQIFPKGNSGAGPTSFHAYRKDGTLFVYGSGTSSVKPPGQSALSAWELVRIYDTSTAQNSVEFGYEPNAATGESVPKFINYTDQDSGWRQQSRVEFSYRARTVNQQAGIAGRFVTNSKLLDKISVFSDGVLAWEYQLSYFYDHLTFEDRLTEVKLCAGGVCLPSTKFRWGPTVSESPNSSQPSARFEKWGEVSHPRLTDVDIRFDPIVVGDWDGDGRQEFARFISEGNRGQRVFVVFRNRPSGMLVAERLYNLGSDPTLVSGDFNADGRSDVLFVGQAMLSAIDGGFNRSTNSGMELGQVNYRDGAFFSLDVDGDGRADVANASSNQLKTFWNSGANFVLNGSAPIYYRNGVDAADRPFYPYLVGDHNGDGRSDVAIWGLAYNGRMSVYRYRSNGTSLDFSEEIPWQEDNGYLGPLTTPKLVGDFNGDGLADLFLGRSGRSAGAHGDGVSFSFRVPAELGNTNLGSTEIGALDSRVVVTGDWNGDGVTDVGAVTATGFVTKLGNQGVLVPHSFDPILSPAQGFTNPQYYSSENRQPLFTGDWNGDGLTDIARVGSDRVHFYTRKKDLTHQLQEITDGYGASVKIAYAPLTDTSIYTKGSGAVYPEVDLQPTTEVVASIERTTALGTPSTTRYSYSGFRHNLLSRQPVGFETMTSTDGVSGDSTTTFFGRAENNKGLPFRTEQRDSTGRLLERQEQSWQLRTHSGNRASPMMIGSVSTSFALDGSAIRSSTTTSTFDGDMNETRRAVVSSDGSIEITERQFRADTNLPRLLERPLSVKVTRKANATDPGITRHSTFTYQSGTGHLETETIEPDSTTERVTKRYEYNARGNPIRVTVSAVGLPDRVSTTEWDPSGRFAIAETNPLGHTVRREFDARFGTAISETDPNGVMQERRRYDGFGRHVWSQFATGVEVRHSHLAPDSDAPAGSAWMQRTDTNGMPPLRRYFDSGGREVRTVSVALDGRFVYLDRAYDSLSRLTHQSLPYFKGAAPSWYVTEYDGLDRPTQMIAPNGGRTTVRYEGLVKIVTNPLGQVTREERNSRGELISVTDSLGGVVRYSRRVDGAVTSIVDPAGNVTQIDYDRRGLRTRLVDPTTGISTFTYDALGALSSEINGNGDEVTYQYDLLGRVTEERSRDGVTQYQYDTAQNGVGKLAWSESAQGVREIPQYDSLGRSIGGELVVRGEVLRETVQYDELGRESIRIAPSGFAVRNRYGHNGALTQVENAATGVSYWRAVKGDAEGRITEFRLGNGLTTVKEIEPRSGMVKRIRTVGDFGMVRSAVSSLVERPILPAALRSGDQQVGGGSSGSIGAVSQSTARRPLLTVVKVPSAVQDLNLSFDSIGNITERRDLVVGRTERFGFDPLNRLTSSTVDGELPVTVSYDALGNILQKSDVGAYRYDLPGKPFHLTEIVGLAPQLFQYDGAGNRIESSDGNIQYSVRGRAIAVSSRNHSVQFLLNARGERVETKTSQSGTETARKVQLGGTFERVRQGQTITDRHYILGSDGPVAMVVLSGTNVPNTRYLHHDHLGSLSVVTDEKGAVVERLSYDPWGKRRDATTWRERHGVVGKQSDLGFTGHEQLDEVQLVHMNGRLYDPTIGRFTSPDPFIQAPEDSQSLNRYSYVKNNPVSYVDPSGFFFKKLFRALGRLLRAALPVIVAVALAYAGGAYFGNWFAANYMCSAAGAGVFSASQAGLILSIGTAATQGFIASTAGALFSGQSVIASFKAGLRGALLSGAQGVTGAASEGIFGKWASSITDVKAPFTGLEVTRESGAFMREVFGIGAQSVANGGLYELFGGEFKNGFKGTLLPKLGRLGIEYAHEEILKAQWKYMNGCIPETSQWRDPARIYAFLSNPRSGLATALMAADPTGAKGPVMMGTLFDWSSSMGIPGTYPGSANGGGILAQLSHALSAQAYEHSPFMNFMAMYVPGFQSISTNHDWFATMGERFFGTGSTGANLQSKLSIPGYMYGVTWTAGYRDLRNTSLIAGR